MNPLTISLDSRPAAPFVILASRGGGDVWVRREGQTETRESFLDVMFHYPPLHMLTRRYYVYQVVWSFRNAEVVYRGPLPSKRGIVTVEVVRPEEIYLDRPKCFSLADPKLKLDYAIGWIEKINGYNTLYKYYTHLPPKAAGGSLSTIRSLIVWLSNNVFLKYFRALADRSDVDNAWSHPYRQPVVCVKERGGYELIAYLIPRGKYAMHPVIHPLCCTDDTSRCVKMVVQELRRIGYRFPTREQKPSEHLWPYGPYEVSTPPRFYPVHSSFVVSYRGVRKPTIVTLGPLTLHLKPLVVDVAIILEAVRSYIGRGGKAIFVETCRDDLNTRRCFGTLITTQAIGFSFGSLGKSVVKSLADAVVMNEELRTSKLLYHLVFKAVEEAYRISLTSGVMKEGYTTQEVCEAALRAWKILRLYYVIRRVLNELGARIDVNTIALQALSDVLSLGVSVLDEEGVEERRARRRPLTPQARVSYKLSMMRNVRPICMGVGVALAVLNRLGVTPLSTSSKFWGECVKHLVRAKNIDKVVKLLKALDIDSLEALEELRDEIEAYAEEAVKHMLTHWLLALHEKMGKLSSTDIEVAQGFYKGENVIYELFEGGVGVTWSISSKLSSGNALQLLYRWLVDDCLALKYEHQISSILQSPDAVEKLLQVVGRVGEERLKEVLTRILGEEPLDSTILRVLEVFSSLKRVLTVLSFYNLVLTLNKLAGTRLRPYEVAAILNILETLGLLDKLLRNIVSETMKKYVGSIKEVDIDELVSSLLMMLKGSVSALLGSEEAEEVEGRRFESRRLALLMEEYGLLDYDAHPICHSALQCERSVEERDVNTPLAYLSVTLIQKALTGG